MSLHPLLLEKLDQALEPGAPAPLTRRDARLPGIPNKVHAVVGMRRVGKTTFLRQLLAGLRADLPAERSLLLSFDDERLADLELAQLGLLLEEFYRRHPDLRGTQTVHWFLDEIQLVRGWERFVRRVIDSEKVEIVVSGSSARMLSREVHTSLRGRGMETVIQPFSFREFLRHRGDEPPQAGLLWTGALRSLVENRFADYLRVGGFPEVQGLDSALRVELLQGYVNSVLLRDVVERYGITQVAALRWLARQALRNPAGSFSVHRLYQDLRAQGLGVAKEALHAMLGHLADAFLITLVPLATESERRRNSNPRKIYPADPGMIGAFDATGRSNVGHALETVVLNELVRQKAEVGYVRTEQGHEVDFRAWHLSGREELIQVCADPTAPGAEVREVRALLEAAREHPRAERLLLTLTWDQAASVSAPGIRVLPVSQWLLDPARFG